MKELNLETSKILDRDLNQFVNDQSLFARADAVGSDEELAAKLAGSPIWADDDYPYDIDDQEPTLEELFQWADNIMSAAIYQ